MMQIGLLGQLSFFFFFKTNKTDAGEQRARERENKRDSFLYSLYFYANIHYSGLGRNGVHVPALRNQDIKHW